MLAYHSNSYTKLACVLVGLPARGKSYIGQKVSRYLQWLGVSTKIFNVGEYRRAHYGAKHSHDWFDPNNKSTSEQRNQAAMDALEDMVRWLRDGGQVAIYDATNSTKERRLAVTKRAKEENIEIIFIESVCDDPDIIMQNIREVKLSSPDYVNMDPEEAAADFIKRIEHYRVAYETIAENEGSYVKLVNVGSSYIINHITGFLQSRIVYYLMNLHIQPRSIYLTRHGESKMNLDGRIGGDSDLSAQGELYARTLPSFFAQQIPNQVNITVWTSTLKRTMQTASFLPYRKLQWRALDEIDAGVCDGLTYEEIEAQFPEDFAARDDDKLNYRYRGGESYRDLVIRLEPIIMELERQNDIIIIGHQAVLRAIYAYYLNLPLEELPYVKVPLHTVIKLTPKAYRTASEEFPLNVQAIDTHRDGRKNKKTKVDEVETISA